MKMSVCLVQAMQAGFDIFMVFIAYLTVKFHIPYPESQLICCSSREIIFVCLRDFFYRGCVMPFACNGTEVLNSRKAISQFDRCCADEECRTDDTSTTTSTTLAPTARYET